MIVNMKKIFVVANYADIDSYKAFDRLSYLSGTFINMGYDTTLITSDFDHHSKKTRMKNLIDEIPRKYKVNMIKELGYKDNICVRRVFSHIYFSWNLKKYLFSIDTMNKPDAIYVTMPFSFATLVCKKYCKKNNIPLIVDVEDLWPDAFLELLELPEFPKTIMKTLVLPWTVISNMAYKAADAVVSHNNTYMNRALRVIKNKIPIEMVYLGTDVNLANECYEKYKNDIQKDDNEFWVTYVGSLAENYDLETMVLAAAKLKNKGYKGIKLMFLGTGPMEDKIKGLCSKYDLDFLITGYIEYSKLLAYLYKSDIGINAIKNSVIIISYKASDYFSAGLPIINSSKGEMQDILDDEQAGFYYETGNFDMMANCIEKLYLDRELLDKMKNNSRDFAVRCLDRKTNYPRIVNLVEKMIK